MDEKVFKDKIQKKLDKQYLDDLKFVMQSKEGRRVFSYLQQLCGYKDTGIKGNSQDFYIAGRRSIAADLNFACDAIGISGNRMAGLDLRQQAEREYIMLQLSIADEIEKGEKG